MIDAVKEYLAANRFGILANVCVIFHFLCGLVFTTATAALRASENGKFSCFVDAKRTATYKKQIDQACFARYDQAYNSPIPLYGFVLLSIDFTVLVSVIYSLIVRTRVDEIESIHKRQADGEAVNHGQSKRTVYVFYSYFVHLVLRGLLVITLTVLQHTYFFPNGFDFKFSCNLPPTDQVTSNINTPKNASAAASRNLNGTLVTCENATASEKWVLCISVSVINIIVAAVILGEVIYLLPRLPILNRHSAVDWSCDSKFVIEHYFGKKYNVLESEPLTSIENNPPHRSTQDYSTLVSVAQACSTVDHIHDSTNQDTPDSIPQECTTMDNDIWDSGTEDCIDIYKKADSKCYSTHAQQSLPGLKASSSQVQGGRERAETSMEELVLIEKYIESPASYVHVYSLQISTKEPFTKKFRKAMTEYVKKLANTNLLGTNDQKPGKQIFKFAGLDVSKNASTQKPARLNKHLVSYIKSIGQIACGEIGGTCFLVADALVITNYHVYRMIKNERTKLGNHNLPITVRFDYLYAEQTEHIVTVEVDEAQDTTLENPYLNYKFFHLKQNEGLKGRVPLGPIVRNWQLSDGQVIILGYPEGKEMQEGIGVVVGYRAIHEALRKRYGEFTGVHLTNAQLLQETQDCHGYLSYDTSFFHGTSGSPVIEMNGNIVAMHTQGYILEREVANIPSQQENVTNPEQENVSRQGKSRKYSLMEFGVQFISICRDIRQWHGEDVVKHIFPNYKLKPGEEETDAS